MTTSKTTPGAYRRLDDKPYASHYVYTETIIDQPVQKVWPHACCISSWMTDHRIETLSGEVGQQGHFEQVFPRNIGEDVPRPHHHYYGIAFTVPFKYIALEVFPEKGGSYGNSREWIGFDGIALVDLGGRTRVIVTLLAVHMGRGEIKEKATQEQEDVKTHEQIERYFENLRALSAAP